jgi:hypothetical protein
VHDETNFSSFPFDVVVVENKLAQGCLTKIFSQDETQIQGFEPFQLIDEKLFMKVQVRTSLA